MVWPRVQSSIRPPAKEMNILSATCYRILTGDLNPRACKNPVDQQFLTTVYVQWSEFNNWIIEEQKVNANFVDTVIFSDKAYFHRNGFGTRHNCRFKESTYDFWEQNAFQSFYCLLFLMSQFEDKFLEDMWFQQDDTTCHSSRETLTILHESYHPPF